MRFTLSKMDQVHYICSVNADAQHCTIAIYRYCSVTTLNKIYSRMSATWLGCKSCVYCLFISRLFTPLLFSPRAFRTR